MKTETKSNEEKEFLHWLDERWMKTIQDIYSFWSAQNLNRLSEEFNKLKAAENESKEQPECLDIH